MRLSPTLAALAVLAALALPTTASAGITSANVSPSSTAAGAHANLTIDMAFNAGDDVKDLVIHLPRGFVGNPQNVGLCTQEQFNGSEGCPANSRVGSNTVTATVTPVNASSAAPPLPLPLPVPVPAPSNPTQTVTIVGSVYNLEPMPGEPARLGVFLPAQSQAGGLIQTQPVRLQSVVSVRTNGDYGLDSTLRDLPTTTQSNLGPLDTHVDRIQLELLGRPPQAKGPYLTNPTTCVPATTTIDTVSYSGAQQSQSSTFTPQACDQLAYAPKITATLDKAGVKQRPTLTTVVSQEPDEATSRKVIVKLPLGVAPDAGGLSPTCSSEEFDAGTCAPGTRVGSASAVSPLLADPLAGAVYLVQPPGGGLPGLGIDLQGLIPTKLRATATFGEARLTSTLDNLPDVPLSSFTLTLGGERAFLVSSRDFCANPGTVDATFTAQNGTERSSSSTVKATNCANAPSRGNQGSGGDEGNGAGASRNARKPRVTAKLRKSGKLVVTAKARKGVKKLRRVKVAKLPRGIKADAKRHLREGRKKAARRIKLAVAPKHLTVRRASIKRKAKVRVVVRAAGGRTYRVKARLKR